MLYALGVFSMETAMLFGATDYASPIIPSVIGDSPYCYTGLMSSEDGYTGSGSVAVHPRLVLGCAHLNYDGDSNSWLPAGTVEWFWKWNEGSFPDDADGIFLTGYYYFSTYQTNVMKYKKDKSRAFQYDFVVNYSVTQDTAGGFAAGWVDAGNKYLTSAGGKKIITGYPAGLYESGDPAKYLMHSTEFSQKMKVERENYLGLDFVQTGSGNSGGPIWVWNNGNWVFAGVLVSGLEWLEDSWAFIGVCSLNQRGWGLIIAAVDNTGGAGDLFTKTVSLANVPLAIPDKGSAVRTFTVSGLVGGVKTINLSLVAPHQRRGDLIVTLRSPSGKTVALTTAVTVAKSSPPNLTLSSKVVSGFSGLFPNGLWTLTVKDSYRNNTGSLQSASIQITTR